MLYCLTGLRLDVWAAKRHLLCAMMFLSNWLNGFGRSAAFYISTQYLSGPAVNFGQNSCLRDALPQVALPVRLVLRRRAIA